MTVANKTGASQMDDSAYITELLQGKYDALHELYNMQVKLSPRHRGNLQKRITGATAEDLETANVIAKQIQCIAGEELEEIMAGYDWICDRVVEEELHFRRSGRYRLSTFAEALEQVYANDEIMRPYMHGLLIAQLWWSNHTSSLRFYRERFLGGFTENFNHLEIGPGHGLLLADAVLAPLVDSVEAWDISESSIKATREALSRLGISGDDVNLVRCDFFDDTISSTCFDSIVFSEVLEHMERPRESLKRIHDILNTEGRLYINVPINCPAPDHLFLLRSPEEAIKFVEHCGFDIEEAEFFPQTNMTLAEARRKEATISVVIIATPK